MATTIRAVRGAAELRSIEELRYRVYIREMGKAYAMADHQAGRLGDSADCVSSILGAFAEEHVVGTVRWTHAADYQASGLADGLEISAWLPIVAPEQLVVCSRLVVDQEFRSSGRIGVSLMYYSYMSALSRGARVCVSSTQRHLVPFFQRFGFRPCGAPFFDAVSGREQWPMVLLLDDVNHLAAIGSPFAAAARSQRRPDPDRAWLSLLQPSVELSAQSKPIPLPGDTHDAV